MRLNRPETVYLLVFFLAATPVDAQKNSPRPDYGLAFASHAVSKDQRTSLNLTPEAPFEFHRDFEIKFDLSYQRLRNAYGYILRIIANDSLNIDLLSSPSHKEFTDLNVIINNVQTDLSYDFSDVGLKPSDWTQIAIEFSYKKDQISLSWNGKRKVEDFPVSKLHRFRFFFGANDFGKFVTSDVPPIIIKDIEILESNHTVRKWPLGKHQINVAYDSVAERPATVKNPMWLLDKHTKWVHRTEFIIQDYPSVAFNSQAGLLYATDKTHLYTFNLQSGKIDEIRPEGSSVYADANQLIYATPIHSLINYDLQTNKFVPFDFRENKWSNNDTTHVETDFWHHNKFFNPEDTSLYVFGGYGHFTYKNSFFRYDEQAGKWLEVKTEGSIPPRYLGAAGLSPENNKAFIFGGYGSISGKQELFPQSFYDLYSFDLTSHEINKIWQLEPMQTFEDLVFSNSLVINERDSCFYVLSFPKNKYNTYIKLRRYGLSRPESTVLADSIPFRFHDEDAFSDLFLSDATKELIAVTAQKEKNGFKISVYSINYPPMGKDEVFQVIRPKKANAALYFILLTTGLLCAFAYYFVRLRKGRKNRVANEQPVEPRHPGKPKPADGSLASGNPRSSINLFGGFQVFDKTGSDITGKFSTTLRELFILILLHSVKFEKGICTLELQEHLWPDKDEVSARNNRNVNIKKLRTLLMKIGDVSIENNNSYLHLTLGHNVFCDYQTVCKILNKVSSANTIPPEDILMILRSVRQGNFLPNIQNTWIDNFKSDISNRIIDLLLEYSQSLDVNRDDKILIEIADAIFNYDSINQEALVIKCSVLNRKGKYSLAKTWYEHFVKEYKHLYSENYPKSFEEVIS